MIKVIMFDLDHTLAFLREVHFHALNLALASMDEKFVISHEEHVKTFDGLSTKQKLIILNQTKKFPLSEIEKVNALKQEFTIPAVKSHLKKDERMINELSKLSDYKLVVVSNSIRNTIEVALEALGIAKFFSAIYSNESSAFPKPNPSLYLKAMSDFGVSPDQTLILEDSSFGRESAYSSGAHIYDVDSPLDVQADLITKFISNIKPKPKKWSAKNTLNVLIPMGGRGQRFANQGYRLPKPLIDVNGFPMIKWVIDSIGVDANFIFIVDQNHINQYRVDYLLNSFVPGCTILIDNPVLSGPATSALVARDYIDNDKHLFIANCDQYLEYNSSEFFYKNIVNNVDGAIITFEEKESSPKWSYARVNPDTDKIIEVKEKQVISNLATTGHYYFNKGSDFVKYADLMIEKNFRVNNEFYVAPTYEFMIADNKYISNYTVDIFGALGTPADLVKFLESNKT